MKRMHALPIDLPLVASGEWNPAGGPPSFKIEGNEIYNKSKVFLVLVYSGNDEERNEQIYHSIIVKNGTNESFSGNPLTVRTVTNTFVYLPKNIKSQKAYVNNISAFQEGDVIYIYTLPLNITYPNYGL